MSQGEIMRELVRSGSPASARALARALRSPVNTVSVKLRRLKRWGYICEVGQEPGTRASLYAPTDAGRNQSW